MVVATEEATEGMDMEEAEEEDMAMEVVAMAMEEVAPMVVVAMAMEVAATNHQSKKFPLSSSIYI